MNHLSRWTVTVDRDGKNEKKNGKTGLVYTCVLTQGERTAKLQFIGAFTGRL